MCSAPPSDTPCPEVLVVQCASVLTRVKSSLSKLLVAAIPVRCMVKNTTLDQILTMVSWSFGWLLKGVWLPTRLPMTMPREVSG